MDKIHADGGQASPVNGIPGMTLLDYFAAQVAAGFCASDLRPPHHEIPRIAYDLATELLNEGRSRAAAQAGR